MNRTALIFVLPVAGRLGNSVSSLGEAMVQVPTALVPTRRVAPAARLYTTLIRLFSRLATVGFAFPQGMAISGVLSVRTSSTLYRRDVVLTLVPVTASPLVPVPMQAMKVGKLDGLKLPCVAIITGILAIRFIQLKVLSALQVRP